MANMLNKSGPYMWDQTCPCPRCVSGPDRRVERRTARRREARAWRREYEAGEYDARDHSGMADGYQFHDHHATAYDYGEYGLPYWLWHNSTDRPHGP